MSVADSGEKIDPNDLDSIDALLDEAELDVVEKSEPSTSTDEVEKDALDSLLDEVSSDEATLPLTPDDNATSSEAKPDEKEPASSEKDALNASDVDSTTPLQAEQPQTMKKAVSERGKQSASTASSLKTDMTVDEMDSIKKMIIIFGSTLTVLVLVGIGIGVWSVFAAKSSAISEETLTLIESTQVSTERIAIKVEDLSPTIQTLEKKLDALNFQLESLAADLLETHPVVATTPTDPVSKVVGKEGTAQPAKAPAAMAAQTASSSSPLSAESIKLVATVNKKMITAQRRMDEVNRRVKDLQSKHKALLLSLKKLEKQMVIQQKKQASYTQKKSEDKSQKEHEQPYQYTAPDGGFYSPTMGDTYP